MRLLKKVVCPACLCLAGHLFTAHANADQFVQFESAAVKPTAFQERNARARGEAVNAVPGTSFWSTSQIVPVALQSGMGSCVVERG